MGSLRTAPHPLGLRPYSLPLRKPDHGTPLRLLVRTEGTHPPCLAGPELWIPPPKVVQTNTYHGLSRCCPRNCLSGLGTSLLSFAGRSFLSTHCNGILRRCAASRGGKTVSKDCWRCC